MYEDFCERFLGQFIHHTPFDDDLASEGNALLTEAVPCTVGLLEDTYGDDLHPMLTKSGRFLLDTDAWVVSCMRSCPESGGDFMGDTCVGNLAEATVLH